MSIPEKKKKKVIISKGGKKSTNAVTTRKKVSPTVSRKHKTSASEAKLIFGRENFKWMWIGLAFIMTGMLLMAGGSMPSPDVWDESLIYSARRITIAPIVIVIGLGIEIYAIFK